jgi:Tol biopolymer transport system component
MPASAAVLDVGNGPLQVAGPIDVTADGTTVVFSAFDPGGVRALYSIKRDGSGLAQLTAGPQDWQPVISPDGLRLVFLRDSGCSVDYWRVAIDGSSAERVSDEALCGVDARVLAHDWSPDGKDIVLVGTDGNLNFLIYRVLSGTTAATYRSDAVLIGRGVDAGGFVHDMQPAWRP